MARHLIFGINDAGSIFEVTEVTTYEAALHYLDYWAADNAEYEGDWFAVTEYYDAAVEVAERASADWPDLDTVAEWTREDGVRLVL